MVELCRLIWCGLIGLFRSRASLEAENLALRHQINVLRRMSPKRPTFNNVDRLILVGLYGFAPSVLSALAVVRPETVIRWHALVFEPIGAGNHDHAEAGSTAYPRRIAQTWHRYRADHSCQIYGEKQEDTVARMEDISPQPRRRHRVNGPVRGSDDLVSAVVRAADSAAWPP